MARIILATFLIALVFCSIGFVFVGADKKCGHAIVSDAVELSGLTEYKDGGRWKDFRVLCVVVD